MGLSVEELLPGVQHSFSCTWCRYIHLLTLSVSMYRIVIIAIPSVRNNDFSLGSTRALVCPRSRVRVTVLGFLNPIGTIWCCVAGLRVGVAEGGD